MNVKRVHKTYMSFSDVVIVILQKKKLIVMIVNNAKVVKVYFTW